MKNMHIGIIGGNGRLGSEIAALCNKKYLIHSKTKIKEIPFNDIDIFIDVSNSDSITHYLSFIIHSKKPLIIGSTGHSKKTIELLTSAEKEIPLLIAPNFSQGIYLLKKMIEGMKLLPTSITETHHAHKKDTPSGTAKNLNALFSKDIPIHSIRKENVAGTHTISYTLPFEDIKITHTAHSRKLFAQGAMSALSFLYQKEKGLYTMDDVYNKDDK